MAEAEFDPAVPVSDLMARFSMRRGLFRREQIDVRVFALSAQHCVIKTDEEFGPGDAISITLMLTMPFENLLLEQLPGVVRNSRKHCSNFFYHIDFKLDQVRAAHTVQQRLQRMVDVIARKKALESRRQGDERPNTSSAR